MKHAVIFKFRLYLADESPNSIRALANLKALCKAHLPNSYEIEVVDVFKEPLRAADDGILMTPTLIVRAPSPVRRITGTLSHTETVLQALDLPEPEKLTA